VIARNAALMVFYTDGSLIGFAFHWTRESGFGYKIPSPAGIFTAELTALFVTYWTGYSTPAKVLDFD
jgi:hypothetical protein